MTASIILRSLREGTADLHQSLESTLPLGGDLTLHQYLTVLRGFYGYWSAWEATARQLAPPHLRDLLTERARAALLERDLLDLGSLPSLVTTRSPQLPPLGTTAGLLGSLYVLEGSRLGGQVLVRNLTARLGLSPEHGLRFFHGFGAQTGAHWKTFCTRVDHELALSDIGPAVDAARATFLGLEAWMSVSGVSETFCITGLETNS